MPTKPPNPTTRLIYSGTYAASCAALGPAPEGFRYLKDGEKFTPSTDYCLACGTYWEKFSTSLQVGNGRYPCITPVPVAAKPEKRVLKIGRVASRSCGVSVVAAKIVEQSHRNASFSPTGKPDFIAKNGLRIASFDEPQFDGHKGCTLYVRGTVTKNDDKILLFTEEEFSKVEAAVAEYNAYVAAPKILKTVAFNYLGGSARGYRVVDVSFEDSTHIKGLDKSLNAPRTYLKSKIEGKILEVKT